MEELAYYNCFFNTSPPLVITHAEVDELIEKLVRTLDETEHYVRSS